MNVVSYCGIPERLSFPAKSISVQTYDTVGEVARCIASQDPDLRPDKHGCVVASWRYRKVFELFPSTVQAVVSQHVLQLFQSIAGTLSPAACRVRPDPCRQPTACQTFIGVPAASDDIHPVLHSGAAEADAGQGFLLGFRQLYLTPLLCLSYTAPVACSVHAPPCSPPLCSVFLARSARARCLKAKGPSGSHVERSQMKQPPANSSVRGSLGILGKGGP